jgi:hypothetical protein
METPMPGADDFTLGDTLPDDAAAESFRQAEHRIYCQALHRDLETALGYIPETEAATVRGLYFEGKGVSDLAQESGQPEQDIRRHTKKGLDHLRRWPANRSIMPYRAEVIARFAHRGGVSSFRYTHTSATERTVIRLEELEE